MSKVGSTGRNPAPATPAPETPAATQTVPAHEAFIGDEHWGKGGRYIIDPATGRRIPAPETPSEA